MIKIKNFLLLLTLFNPALMAAPATYVEHSHGGRQHSHQLPFEGIYHRHANGPLGEVVDNNPKEITTMVYGDPQPEPRVTVKPAKPQYQSTVISGGSARGNNVHSHNRRQHSHPLPAQGIAHRHGSGSLGVSVANEAESSGGLVFDLEEKAAPQDEQANQYRRQSSSQTRQKDYDVYRSRTNPWKNKPERFTRQSLTKGSTRCRPGQTDCNVCAANVEQQFQKAANQQISWRRIPWRFNWPQRYPPENLSPMDIFNGDPDHPLGIPDTHVQGFVRTNSPKYPLAGSHSHKKKGGVFVVGQSSKGEKYLSTLHKTKGRHPSGVHIIGKYLVYGVGKRLYFKDINSPNHGSDISLSIPKPLFGGGLGVLKLARDRHLVVTTGPGNQDSRQRFNRFYLLKSVNGRPSSIEFLNQSTTNKPSQWPKTLAFSENLSLITDCGTGNIYAIHTTGDQGLGALTGRGYWRLSKLVQRDGILGLTALNAFSIRQNMKNCNMRAAASVHINPQKRLEFYCHGYAKDPDGTTFNVLGKSSRNKDKFYYKVGIVK